MSDDQDLERLLRTSLQDEADEVESAPDGLQQITARTRRPARATRRSPWLAPVLVAGAAAATVFGVVTLVQDDDVELQPSGPPGRSTASEATTTATATKRVRVFYVSEVAGNLPYRVFSEQHQVPVTNDPFNTGAGQAFLDDNASDPDYTSGWPAGVRLVRVSPMADRGWAKVYLRGRADLASAHGMPAGEAKMATDAFVRSVGMGDQLQLYYNGKRVTRLLGQRVDRFVSAMPDGEALAPVQVTSPVDGQEVGADVTIRGNAWVFEGTVSWTLTSDDGSVKRSGYTTAGSADRRSPWRQRFTGLPSGTYRFSAYELSAEDGSVTYVDTKTFVVP